jgi:membrane protease YdiL (CAAX protease family)
VDTSKIINNVVYLPGLFLFGYWLLKTSLGRNALADSMPRRNNIRPLLCLIPLFIWFGPVPLAIQITRILAADLQDWQKAFLENFIYVLGALVVMAVIIFLVRAGFSRKLKGFGLNVRSIHKDFFAAFANLLTIWPLMMAAMIVTLFFAKLIYGPEYQIPRHEQLKVLTDYPQLQLRILTFVVAAVVAPVLEEMMFRGLLQTVIRSYLETRNVIPPQNGLESPCLTAGGNRAWIAVLISSFLFSIVHGNIPHWPALFVLGVCLGYAYEKSGSLFRPIFIHAFFNATSVILVLLKA